MTVDEAALSAATAEARAHWPTLHVPDEAWRAHVLARAVDTPLERLCLRDLYLTCAVGLGLPGAAELVDAHAFARLDPVLRRLGASDALAQDLKQRLREKLLVGSPPKLTSYGGKGELIRWLKVTATREALVALEAQKKHRKTHLDDDEALEHALSPHDGPELDLLKRTYRAEFRVAFHGALAALEPRSRTILRYYLVDGLTIDQLGAVYGVHRATAARWIERLREDLLLATRERLMAQVEVGRAELDSIMRLIQSQLDVSIQRHLRDEP